MNGDMAEIIALKALAYLAADEQRILGFCRMTGTAPDALAALARTRDGLAAVLEYLMQDEPMLLAFAAEAGLAETEPAEALHTLSRGAPGAAAGMPA